MLRRLGLPVGLAGLALAFSACGSSLPTGTNSGDALTTPETQELMNAFFDRVFSIDLTIPGLDSHMANPLLFLSTAASVPVSDSYSSTDACDGGGTSPVSATASGTYDDQTGDADVKVEGSVGFNQCVFSGTQATYTINGDPSIGVTANFKIRQQSATIDFKFSGGVAFQANDKSGSCNVDLSVTLTLTSTGQNQTASGSVCGVNASDLNIDLNF